MFPQTYQISFPRASESEKKDRIFSMGKFFRKHALLDNWNAVLNILPESFYQETEKKSAQTRKLHGFFKRSVLFSWIFSSGNVAKTFNKPSENFLPTVPGTFWILLFFSKTNVLFQKVPLAHRLQFIQNCRKFPRKVWNDVVGVPKFLMVFNFFFKILFPSICSSSMYTGVLTTLPNSCRQRPKMFPSNLKTNWRYKIFFQNIYFSTKWSSGT